MVGAAVFLIQIANFYSMGLDLMERAEWVLCPTRGPKGEGSCTPRDAVPSMRPLYVAPVLAGVGALLLLLRGVLDLRAHAREVSVTNP